jgi:hypothetical protein
MGLSLRNPLDDGRQSQAALAIARGASRLLLAHGMACVPELSLANGRRADLAAISDKNEIWIVEIKSCVADFRADQKWPDYRAYCDRLFFAVAGDFPRELLPEDTGIIVADRYGGDIVRPAPEHRLGPAVRKAVTLGLARTAAWRLLGVSDPELRLEEPLAR